MTDLFDPGKDSRETGQAQADAGIMTGGSSTGPGGITTDFDFSGGKVTNNQSLGEFGPLLEQFLSLSQGGAGQAEGGLPPELMELGLGTIDDIGAGSVDQFGNDDGVNALQKMMQSSLGDATADPFDLGKGISDKLRAREQGRTDRRINTTFDRLKASGKLGTSGGAGIAGELDRNIKDQDLGFDIAGLNFGQGVINDARATVKDSFAGLESSGSRTFAESFNIENRNDTNALQKFGVGDQMFSQWMASRQQGSDIAGNNSQQAGILAQLPLSFQNALLNAGTTASNTNFAASGANMQAARDTKSPFLEALNAAGSFVSAVKPV